MSGEFRVRLLHDTTYYDTNAKPEFTLSAGDILICSRMAWPWSEYKFAILRRESDGFKVERSIHKGDVEVIAASEGEK